MEYGSMSIQRLQSGRWLNWGIRFFLTAALTASQTDGGYAPFALGCIAAAGPGADGAAALLGLFFLLRLPGLPPVPCLLTCCVLAVPVILLAFGTLSGLELTVIVGRLWRDLIYNANRRPFQRRD